MAQYTTVLANEFNTVRTTVANVLGTGATTRGYGSSITSYAVSTGSNISPAEFTALTTDINTCYRHITNADATGLASVVSGNVITWSNIVTYQVAATYIDTNRDTNGGTVTNPAATSKVLSAGWGNASGNRIATVTGTFTWANADAMRFYFNQNSKLIMSGTGATTGGTAKDNAFGTLATGVSLVFDKTNYRAGTGVSQAQTTNVSPYSTGTPDGITVSIAAPGTNTIGFTITCSDTGDDGSVASNVAIDLTFNAATNDISNTTGIAQHTPTITFATDWSYSA